MSAGPAVLSRNVFGILDRSAPARYGDEPWFGFEGEIVTFREMRVRSLDVAAGLSAAGARSGDRVAVMMDNSLEWVELFLVLGAVCVPVNALMTGPEIGHDCTDSDARILVANTIAASRIADTDHLFDLVIALDGAAVTLASQVLEWDDVRRGGAWPPPGHREPDLDDTLILYYSSGTTGLPKAAEHTHDSVRWNSFGQVSGLGLTPQEDVLLRLPGVLEVALVGVPHERFGETPVAVVVPTDPDFDPASVEAACASRLAWYKLPRWVLVRSEPLPRNANAKLLKREIRPGPPSSQTSPWKGEHHGF